MSWADASLTDKGLEHGRRAHQFWATAPEADKVPIPEAFYASPLIRCLQTVNLTFVGQPYLTDTKKIVVDEVSGRTESEGSNN